MGLTGELVRSVFSKNRSVGSHDSNVRSFGTDKRRWSAVRSYLCGDEFNSVLAEEDSASIRSSEATVTQPTEEELKDIESEAKEGEVPEGKGISPTPLSCEEDAAIVIQSAFRRFMVKRRDAEAEETTEKGTLQREESPSRQSVGTSVEVQTGGSIDIFVCQERIASHHRVHQKARSHVSRLKEDWDDSTVSSNISKLRLQNRLEATTRRERALAYAFSQQLRVCSKKRPTQSDTSEPNMGWSWLERWMATRPPETFSVEDRMSKQHEPIFGDRRSGSVKKSFDLAAEEKESCGSNEVAVGFESLTVTSVEVPDSYKPVKNRPKATKTVSRRKTAPSYHYSTLKVNRKDCAKEAEDDWKHKKAQQLSSVGEMQEEDASAQSISSTEHQ